MSSEFRVYTSLEEAGPGFGPCALTIGNFDGVHLAHQRLLQRVVQTGSQRGWTPSVMTFDPHPARVVAPQRAPRLLSAPRERAEWMRRSGIRQVLILPFDAAFSQLTAGQFIRRILVGALAARAIVVGENFRFGRHQRGDASLLAALGDRFGYSAEVLPGMGVRGRMVSSSEVRRLIDAGRVSLAWRLLGRPYALTGQVTAGRGVGSRMTVPTLNLSTPAEVLPAQGVYVTRTREPDGGRVWPSVTNIGARPTFGPGELSIETYLLEPLEGGGPQRISVEFLSRLREERKFESPEALRAQILRDAARAAAWHRRARRWLGAG